MDFFNKLGKKASETYQFTKEKASNLSEELKIRGKISDTKEKINKIYTEIGEVVYSEIKAGTDVSKDEITEKCEEISRLYQDIEKFECELLVLKKIKKCSKCGEELDLNSEFCSKCGEKQPTVEKVEVKEEPEEVKNAEVVEVKDVEENEDQKEQETDNN